MRIPLSIALLMLIPALALSQAGRKTAAANLVGGHMEINYGSPAWKAEFQNALDSSLEKAGQMAYRLGNNDPTTMTITGGLATNEAIIPPGDYKLAVQMNKDGQWRLAIYQGEGQWNLKRDAWLLDSAVQIHDRKNAAENLIINVNDKGLMSVAFGPHLVVYPIQMVKALPVITEEYANIPVKVECMALPCDSPLKDVCIGRASAQITAKYPLSYDMYLTMEGDNAVLNFKSGRQAQIAQEKAGIESMVARLKTMMEGDMPEARKERIVGFMEQQEAQLESLSDEAQRISRLKSSAQVTGSVKKSEHSTSNLRITHERPQGLLILHVAAGDKIATFEVNPRQFRGGNR